MIGNPDKEGPIPSDPSSSISFLNKDQQELFTRDFTVDNFRIATLDNGDPFLVVELPSGISILVEIVQRGARLAALEKFKTISAPKFTNSGLTEKQEAKARSAVQRVMEATLMPLTQSFMHMAVYDLVRKGLTRAYTTSMTTLRATPDPDTRNASLRTFQEKADQINKYLFGAIPTKPITERPLGIPYYPDNEVTYSRADIRYVVLSNNQPLSKSPENLQLPANP